VAGEEVLDPATWRSLLPTARSRQRSDTGDERISGETVTDLGRLFNPARSRQFWFSHCAEDNIFQCGGLVAEKERFNVPSASPS
jgi:hypothetical protein